ncbi:MAG: prepilin-type N-terminal cleavage/methylation domain-containing protein [Gammaproteobacteria bacterium]|nr:prepilin-type N-terminal cleavage/methylation domain-containing protein [Gammaproteobacteria bacterium]
MTGTGRSAGFTLIELIIAVAIALAAMIYVSLFLHQMIATRDRVVPRAASVRGFVLLNGQLRRELGAADSLHIRVTPHTLSFLSSARFAALAPGRHLYVYRYDVARRSLQLAVYAAPRGLRAEAAVQRRVFIGTVLDRVRSLHFSVQRDPPAARPVVWRWETGIDTLRVPPPRAAAPFAALRLDLAFDRPAPRLPPLIYRLGEARQ